jgi:hypothetical protein
MPVDLIVWALSPLSAFCPQKDPRRHPSSIRVVKAVRTWHVRACVSVPFAGPPPRAFKFSVDIPRASSRPKNFHHATGVRRANAC